jgi:hypothetical protein
MAWHLNRALSNFRAMVNARYPRRDRSSDGTIGDPDHQARSSDHNPDGDGSVDAWDMDVELHGPGRPYAADVEALKAVFEAHPAAGYWIHNRVIASRDVGNWRRRPYDGDNPHDKHVHWNTRQTHENSQTPWPIEPPEGDVSASDVWNHTIASPAMGQARTAGDWLKQAEAARRAAEEVRAELGAAVAALAVKVDQLAATPPGSVVLGAAQLEQIAARVADLLAARLQS